MSALVSGEPHYRVTVDGGPDTLTVGLPGPAGPAGADGAQGPAGPKGDPGTGAGGIKATAIDTSITGIVDFIGTAGSGAWTQFPAALQATLAAAVDDVVSYEVQILSTGSDAEMDAAAIVDGAPVRYYSSGTAVQSTRGSGGLYVSGNFGHSPKHRVVWVVEAGDTDADGNLTLAFLYRAGGSGHTWTTAATTGDSAAYPAAVLAINYGPG